MRIRLAVVPAVLLLALAWRVPVATAAAEVHRFNVVLSAVPTQLRAADLNSLIDNTNRTELEPRGLAPLDRIKFSWLFDAELRYFVRQNLAVSAGVGQIRKSTSQEYLPGIGQGITVSAHITSVPLHAGAAYYLRPYNQGDFQARAYVGGGFMSVVYNRASLGVDFAGVPGQASSSVTGTNDAPGYYGEMGAHLFFAIRYSVLLSGLYRSNQVRNLVEETSGALMRDPQGRPLTLDVGGVGFRMAMGIGL
jgi:hypothetical protein